MTGNWPTKPLGELLELVIDHRGKTPNKMGFKNFHDCGYPVLSAKHVKMDQLVNLESIRYSNERMYKKWMKVEIQEGDIVLTSEAPLGQVLYLDGKIKYLLGQRVFGLRPNKELINPLYLSAWLASPKGQSLLEARATGSTVLGIKQAELLRVEVDIPPEHVQEVIARTRYDLVQKIELNTQTNQTLEQIAQAIFKSWFVDFDPVKAKIAVLEAGGTAEQAELAAMSAISAQDESALKQLQAEQPEAYAELAQTAALFPAVMEESELGLAPKGWKVSKLASYTTELRRGISPKYVEDGGVSVINQKCIRNHTIDFTLARRHDSSKRKIDGREVEIGDVLVNSTGVGTLGRLSPVRYLEEVTVVDSHVTVVRADISKISKSFLAGLMIQNESYIEASGAGSTGQTELRKHVLEDIVFTHPSHELDHKFNAIANSINRQIAELEKQQSTLACCRDSVIPKLLSGKL